MYFFSYFLVVYSFIRLYKRAYGRLNRNCMFFRCMQVLYAIGFGFLGILNDFSMIFIRKTFPIPPTPNRHYSNYTKNSVLPISLLIFAVLWNITPNHISVSFMTINSSKFNLQILIIFVLIIFFEFVHSI